MISLFKIDLLVLQNELLNCLKGLFFYKKAFSFLHKNGNKYAPLAPPPLSKLIASAEKKTTDTTFVESVQDSFYLLFLTNCSRTNNLAVLCYLKMMLIQKTGKLFFDTLRLSFVKISAT